jgi:hypothetical protein
LPIAVAHPRAAAIETKSCKAQPTLCGVTDGRAMLSQQGNDGSAKIVALAAFTNFCPKILD